MPPLTTLGLAPTHVELPAGEGGLKETSMAECEQVTTLDKSFLIRGLLLAQSTPLLWEKLKKLSDALSESLYFSNRLIEERERDKKSKRGIPETPWTNYQWVSGKKES